MRRFNTYLIAIVGMMTLISVQFAARQSAAQLQDEQVKSRSAWARPADAGLKKRTNSFAPAIVLPMAETTLTFDELPIQPVNGLSFMGVTFGFTVNGAPSDDARYNAGGPVQTRYVQDPSLEGDANGILTLTFEAPVSPLRFGVALNSGLTLSPGCTVQLFNASSQLIGTFPVNTAPTSEETFFTEAQFNYSGAPASRAVISFSTTREAPVSPRFAIDNLTFNLTQGPPTDLAVGITDARDPVATGERVTYRVTVNNAGPNAANGVVVNTATPTETTFASVSQRDAQTPPAGATGQISVSLGAIPAGGSASFDVTFNVLAAGGTTLSAQAIVTSNAQDSNPANDQATTTTLVQGGGLVELSWQQVEPTPANPTPQPVNLMVKPAGASTDTSQAIAPAAEDAIAPQEGDCILVQVNIYKTETSPAAALPENLWRSVPPQALKAVMGAAPQGSFYAITNVYNCGGMVMESQTSNEASTPQGATVTGASLTANGVKLKVRGIGFSSQVDVMVDGVGFVQKGKGKAGGTKLVQKGNLLDGRTLTQALPVGQEVLLTFVNANGGVASFSFTR
ncbi:MAG TPA: DUF11 domain-containing protein [Blastocatellia bacterium]|nr:DUF11 domain-containing protein [Blastocatellia bacterium]